MNFLLIIGLAIFICFIFWIYFLFITNTVDESPKRNLDNIDYTNALSECNRLLDEGRYSEAQTLAQKALSKNYSDIGIRKVLAKAYIEQNDMQMAIMHYEAILNISPYDIEIQEFLAQYYDTNGPRSRAVELYEQILMYDSGNFQAVEALATLYKDRQDNLKAIQMYELLAEAEFDQEKLNRLQYTLAELYLAVEDNEKALEMYKVISNNSPDNLEVLLIIADLAYKNKLWEECLEYYNKVVSIVGDDFEILEKIASVQTLMEDWQNVVKSYENILSLEHEQGANYLYHQNEYCQALIKCDRGQEAIEKLKTLLVKYPRETSFAFTLANAYATTGNYQIGIELYKKLMDEIPSDQGDLILNFISNLTSAWAQSLFDKGDYNQAFDKFFDALKYNEDNDDVYYRLGVCNYRIKSFNDALVHFKKAISIKSDIAQYYFALGCAYDEIGASKDALESFNDALNLEPTFVKARIAYAIQLTKELEYAQSAVQFLEILKYIPDNADTIYNLALAYEMVGDTERAIKYYKDALAVEPEHKEALNNIKLLLGEDYVPAAALTNED